MIFKFFLLDKNIFTNEISKLSNEYFNALLLNMQLTLDDINIARSTDNTQRTLK
jgi:hypothetical protein